MSLAKAEIVYRALRASIESGEFEPGQALPENFLVEKTGFSRTPVREALRQLSSDGLVDIEPRRAPTVSIISIQSTRELFSFRRIVEIAAVELLANRAESTPLIRDTFDLLANQFEDLAKDVGKSDFEQRFYELATEFDEKVLSLTPNQYIVSAIAALKPHLTRVRRISKTDKARLPQSIGEHISICRAISDGLSDQASGIMRTHLEHVEDAVFRQLISGTTGVQVALT